MLPPNKILSIRLSALAWAIGVLIGLLLLHTPAIAQEDDEEVKISIPYTPQDLTDPARASHLLVLIDRAAIQACSNPNGMSQLLQNTIEHSDCRTETFTSTVAAFKSPLLSTLAQSTDPWLGPKETHP